MSHTCRLSNSRTNIFIHKIWISCEQVGECVKCVALYLVYIMPMIARTKEKWTKRPIFYVDALVLYSYISSSSGKKKINYSSAE